MEGVQNFKEEIDTKEHHQEKEKIGVSEDCKMILSQINKQVKQCKLKRRWLMGLELTVNETNRMQKLLPPTDGFLPESMLREDDMSKLLRDPINYHEKCNPQLTRAAAMRILEGMDDFPILALRSMHRKLRRVKGYIPRFQSSRSGWCPGALVKQVRKKCLQFLSELGEEAPLQKPLAHALAVANLTIKLRCRSVRQIEFRDVSPEIDTLQNDIMRAIWLLADRRTMNFENVKYLLNLLDPHVEAGSSIRILIRNLLTEYLFECADMVTIPERLVEALAFINKITNEDFSMKDTSLDVEGVLSVSSQAKQIVWDYIPECENDLDSAFANAYQDDMVESDDDYFSDDGLEEANFPGNQIEGFGECNSTCISSPISAGNKKACTGSGIKSMNNLNSPGKSRSQSPSSSCLQEENSHSIPVNKYLSIQKACDNSSTVAYHLIGDLLNKFAEVGGLDLDEDNLSYLQSKHIGFSESQLLSRKNVDICSPLISVLEEQSQSKIKCSLPSSSLQKLKKIMS